VGKVNRFRVFWTPGHPGCRDPHVASARDNAVFVHYRPAPSVPSLKENRWT
jgi:hypothetical protein